MTQEVITGGPDDTVRMLAALFTNHGISAVAVCDRDGTLLGDISEGDVMRPLGQANQLRRDWWLGRGRNISSSWNTCAWTTDGHVT